MKIKHSLEFETELDVSNPSVQMLLSMPKERVVAFLEGMLKELVAPRIQPVLDEINDCGSCAILRVAM